MIQSKYSNIFLALATWVSQSIHLFALKIFDADCNRWSTSQVVDFSKVVVSMHPSHLWLDSWSIIEMVNPWNRMRDATSPDTWNLLYKSLMESAMWNVNVVFLTFTSLSPVRVRDYGLVKDTAVMSQTRSQAIGVAVLAATISYDEAKIVYIFFPPAFRVTLHDLRSPYCYHLMVDFCAYAPAHL